jgi:hypothetical protein
MKAVSQQFPEESLLFTTRITLESGQQAKAYYPEYIEFLRLAEDNGLHKPSPMEPKPMTKRQKKIFSQSPDTKPELQEDGTFAPIGPEKKKELRDWIKEKIPYWAGVIAWEDVFRCLEAGCNLQETAAFLRVPTQYLIEQTRETYGISFLDLQQQCWNAGIAKIRIAMQTNVTSDHPNPIVVAMVVKTRVPSAVDGGALPEKAADIIYIDGRQVDMNELTDEEIEMYLQKLEAEENGQGNNSITEAQIVSESEEASDVSGE